jgi:rare lipoprotein A
MSIAFGKIGRIALVVLLAAAVAACATRPVRAPAPPKPSAEAQPAVPAPVPSPVYKVGEPYQVAGIWYYPREQPDYDETGIASWYGSEFHGQPTSNGEVFDRNAISAAHPTLPMPANVRVTNLENGRSIVVRVNDRGPFLKGRVIDLSEHAADLLGYRAQGTARVRVTFLGRADLHGPGLATPAEETPSEIASAVPAAPTAKIAAAELPPVMGVQTAPPRVIVNLPMPTEQTVSAVQPDVPDGHITAVQVPVATAIYVQAGAFSSAVNAAMLASRLQSVNAKVYPGQKDGRPIYRVRIGPFQVVEQADQTLTQVQGLGFNDLQIVVDAPSAGA